MTIKHILRFVLLCFWHDLRTDGQVLTYNLQKIGDSEAEFKCESEVFPSKNFVLRCHLSYSLQIPELLVPILRNLQFLG